MAVRQLNFRVTQQGLDNMPTQKTALTGTHQGQVPVQPFDNHNIEENGQPSNFEPSYKY